MQGIWGNEGEIPVITLDAQLEQILHKAQQQSGDIMDEGVVIEPMLAERLQRSLSEAAQKQEVLGAPAVLLVSAGIRHLMSRFTRGVSSSLHVLSYLEVPDNKQITIVASIGSQ